MSNLTNKKVFVYDPGTNALVVANTAKPVDLVVGQVGVFNANTLVGATATPTPANTPGIQIHQNVGDSRHGTVRTKVINAQQVKRYYAHKARAAAQQITYIGYDESVATKNIKVKKGEEVSIIINLYVQSLTRWYGPAPYTRRISIDLSHCKTCVSDCTLLDSNSVADAIVAAVNGTSPANAFKATTELPNYLTASKVTTGTGDTLVHGVKIVTKNTFAQKAINTCDPKDFFELETCHFTVGLDNNCNETALTTTQKFDPGTGWPAEVAQLERESQGYDRVRDQFDNQEFMALANFKIFAQSGVKYDAYHIEFDVTHRTTGLKHSDTETYSVIIFVPTTTGGDLETLLNAWLPATLGFSNVTISSSTGTGTTTPVVNA